MHLVNKSNPSSINSPSFLPSSHPGLAVVSKLHSEVGATSLPVDLRSVSFQQPSPYPENLTQTEHYKGAGANFFRWSEKLNKIGIAGMVSGFGIGFVGSIIHTAGAQLAAPLAQAVGNYTSISGLGIIGLGLVSFLAGTEAFMMYLKRSN